MDQFLSKLNLQNLLRQFCCGVVFFMPLCLFYFCNGDNLSKLLVVHNMTLLCIFAVAFCIGTFIYHFEKNLYSYLVQFLFEAFGSKALIGLIFCYIMLIIAAMINICFGLETWKILQKILNILWLYIGLFPMILGAICCMIIPIFSKKINLKCNDNTKESDTDGVMWYCIDNNLIDRTEKCWKIEGGAENVSKAQRSIANKVAVWADFIHCIQSSCLAWILGTAFLFYLQHAQVVNNIPVNYMKVGNLVALIILMVEIGVDAHRYIHVKIMTSPCMQVTTRMKYTGTITKDSEGKILTQAHIENTFEL